MSQVDFGFLKGLQNLLTHFGFGGRIPRYKGCGRRGVGGACKYIQHPLLHYAKVCGLAASVLIAWGPENSRVPLRTPASAHRPVVTSLSSSSRLKQKGREKG
jgi:hypothetical protein